MMSWMPTLIRRRGWTFLLRERSRLFHELWFFFTMHVLLVCGYDARNLVAFLFCVEEHCEGAAGLQGFFLYLPFSDPFCNMYIYTHYLYTFILSS